MLRKNNCLLQQIAFEDVRLFYISLAQTSKAPRANKVPNRIEVVIAHIENRTYQISAEKKALTFIDLFAGIGGMRLATFT